MSVEDFFVSKCDLLQRYNIYMSGLRLHGSLLNLPLYRSRVIYKTVETIFCIRT